MAVNPQFIYGLNLVQALPVFMLTSEGTERGRKHDFECVLYPDSVGALNEVLQDLVMTG